MLARCVPAWRRLPAGSWCGAARAATVQAAGRMRPSCGTCTSPRAPSENGDGGHAYVAASAEPNLSLLRHTPQQAFATAAARADRTPLSCRALSAWPRRRAVQGLHARAAGVDSPETFLLLARAAPLTSGGHGVDRAVTGGGVRLGTVGRFDAADRFQLLRKIIRNRTPGAQPARAQLVCARVAPV